MINSLMYMPLHIWKKYITDDDIPYYVNNITKQSWWYPPDRYWMDRDPNLPAGWTKGIDIHGKVYYMNHVGQYVTTKHPYAS